MADLPEDAGWVEGVTMIDPSWPVKGGPVQTDSDGNPTDGYSNLPLQQLASRTKYLYDNMGSGGGGSTGTPLVWLDGSGMSPEFPVIPIGLLEPGKHYILDNRSNALYGILVHSDDDIDEIQSLFEYEIGVSLNLKEIPVGSEFHFTLAGDPDSTQINDYSFVPPPEPY